MAGARVLVVGGGGREHALAWKLSQSPLVDKVFVSPGNAGTALAGGKISNVALDDLANETVCRYAKSENIDLVVVGPEKYLMDGMVDALAAENIKAFGPTREESRLEWSKAFAKEKLSELAIPTADYRVCDSLESGLEIIKSWPFARVVKYDGLAAGKGVYVTKSALESVEALKSLGQDYGADPDFKVCIEELLSGEELSLFCLCDGKSAITLSVSQDHKRRFAGENGPNTGGMGAYSPVALYEKYRELIESQVVSPLNKAMGDGRFKFKGLLFVGLLVGKSASCPDDLKPYVLEFNARFGDPETEAIMPYLSAQCDLFSLLMAAAEGKLSPAAAKEISWRPGASLTTIIVHKDYPATSSKDVEITIGEMPEGVTLFHCGTYLKDGRVYTNGGRIFAPVAQAETLEAARALCLEAIAKISFADMDYRQDIGAVQKTVNKETLCH